MRMSERFILEIGSLFNQIVQFFDDVINSVVICFSRYFDFEGRSSRSEFWHWQLFRVLLFLSLTFLETILFSGLNFTFNLFLLIPEISVSIRRLHDTNKSGLWYLLTFTIIGIIPLIYFYSLKGDETKNNYNY
ncbi:MAG: hypothetical protein CML90_02965 [Rhodobiaceae bacterium]|nr:hypothetical protein [Rhodobiaceae bacterium]